ncbi:MAG: hypothetical protein ACOYLF_18005, partial [Blastocatellia bacterium]
MAKFWSVLLIVMVWVLPVIGQAPPESGRERGTEEVTRRLSEGSRRNFREVEARLQGDGTIPVLIRLRSMGGEASIRQAQESLMEGMAGYDPTSIKRFQYIPYLRLRIDSVGYERLRSAALVDDIQEDNAVHPDLAARARVVKGAFGRSGHGGGAGQSVALIGAGVDRNHPELAGRVVAEGCFSTTDAARGVTSRCAGEDRTDCSLAGGACETDTGRALLAAGRDSQADKVSLVPIQVFSRIGRGDGCPNGRESCLVAYDSDVILGLEKVIELSQSRRIAAVSLNVSNLRLTENCDEDGSAIGVAIRRLRESGILTVVAAERDGVSHSCSALGASPAHITGFSGEAAELAGLLAVARSIAPWAGPDALLGALAGAGTDYTRFNEAMGSLAGRSSSDYSLLTDQTGTVDLVPNR